MQQEHQLSADEWRAVIDDKALVRAELNADFPGNPREQLRAVGAVFHWMNQRAITYRCCTIPQERGMPFSVEAMVSQHGQTLGNWCPASPRSFDSASSLDRDSSDAQARTSSLHRHDN